MLRKTGLPPLFLESREKLHSSKPKPKAATLANTCNNRTTHSDNLHLISQAQLGK